MKRPLPNRVFSSPLIRFANFVDGSRINLIRLSTPYADGRHYAIYSTNKDCYNGMFTKYERALKEFNEAVKRAGTFTEIVSQGVTGNAEKV